MPTYAYACQQCDHTFEVRQSFSDDALTTCPECSGRLRKLFNSVGIVFKGSGFYRNDSRDSAKGSSSTGSSGSSSDGASKAGSSASSASSSASPAPSASSSGSSSAGSSGSAGSSSKGSTSAA
ncbi:FmdB family zinc ribbon protein [Kineococcus sp. SYSU DK018]|uniref:FmdB family zinc ribbon protein n=1 Tax=Kineococcus sp. SYSU DK018 TaxID=3383139 RepID=UPI003D7C4B95